MEQSLGILTRSNRQTQTLLWAFYTSSMQLETVLSEFQKYHLISFIHIILCTWTYEVGKIELNNHRYKCARSMYIFHARFIVFNTVISIWRSNNFEIPFHPHIYWYFPLWTTIEVQSTVLFLSSRSLYFFPFDKHVLEIKTILNIFHK